MKKFLLLDTGFYWLNVIELNSNDKIELNHDLLESVIPELIKNGYCDFIKDDDDESINELKNDYDEIEGYIYLDLSYSDLGYNIYLNINNLKLLDIIPDTYNIDYIINL